MTKEEKDELTSILFAQAVARARNVNPTKQLEALHGDVGAVILGDKPEASWNLTRTKAL